MPLPERPKRSLAWKIVTVIGLAAFALLIWSLVLSQTGSKSVDHNPNPGHSTHK